MNMKTFGIIAILAIFSIISSCNKEDETTVVSVPTVVLFTDNASYVDIDNIVLTIKNETNDSIKYGACGFSNIFDKEIQKKTDTGWITSDFTLCIDYVWADLAANSQVNDTISAALLDEGDYRIKMKSIVASNNTVLYSGEFNKK